MVRDYLPRPYHVEFTVISNRQATCKFNAQSVHYYQNVQCTQITIMIMGNNKLNARPAHEVTRTHAHAHAHALVFGPKSYGGIGYNDVRIEQGLDAIQNLGCQLAALSPAIIRVLDCFIH